MYRATLFFGISAIFLLTLRVISSAQQCANQHRRAEVDGALGRESAIGCDAACLASLAERLRQEHVTRVNVFVVRYTSGEVRTDRILYYGKDTTDCSQITDEQQLTRVRESGLDEQVRASAVREAGPFRWGLCIDSCGNNEQALALVTFFDNTTLERPKTVFSPFTGNLAMGSKLVAYADEIELRKLLDVSRPTSAELDSALLQAPKWGDDSCIARALLNAGASPEAEIGGTTALMNAVAVRAINDVKVLVSAGADVNAHRNDGKTALMLAAVSGDSEIATVLLKAGADSSIAAFGETALTLAQRYHGTSEITHVLQKTEGKAH